jgi:hypothetical protein
MLVRGRDRWEYLGEDWRIILKLTMKNYGVWIGFIWIRIWTPVNRAVHVLVVP